MDHEIKNEKKHEMKHSSKGRKKEYLKDYKLWGLILALLWLIILTFQVAGINQSLEEVDSKLASLEGSLDDGSLDPNGARAPSRPADPRPSPRFDMTELIDDDTVRGESGAPVTIVEFSDFECPFCTRFYQQTLPQIEENYIKTGKVKFVYRDFPLSFHENAQKAAEAAECAAEQGGFWEMHDMLFDEGVSGGVASFKQFAQDLGLDTTEFNECLDSGEMETEVKKDLSDGAAVGITGTPGFIINGKLVSGAQPFEVFEQVIEEALG